MDGNYCKEIKWKEEPNLNINVIDSIPTKKMKENLIFILCQC